MKAAHLAGLENWYKRAVVAKLLGVSVSTLEKWAKAGKGPEFTKFPNGTIRYSHSAVQRFMRGE